MKKTGISILLFACVLFAKPAICQDNSKPGCRIYLNFPYYSFEITGGFEQIYKIANRYQFFSQQCHEFLNYISTKPVLYNSLFYEDEDMCNGYYKIFFDHCRCDSSSFLYIYNIPESASTKEKKELFDKNKFDLSLLQIRDSTIKALRRAFPGYVIKIEISSAERSVNDQEKYVKSGASTTLFSAHILGAAADFTIFFNGILIDPKPESKGFFQSYLPYQILGKFILDKGYFWGIPWDPGHMQLRRKIQDILKEFPELQGNTNIITSYCRITENDTIPLKYEPVIELLDRKFGSKEKRNYDITQPWKEDTLLAPFTVDSLYKPPHTN